MHRGEIPLYRSNATFASQNSQLRLSAKSEVIATQNRKYPVAKLPASILQIFLLRNAGRKKLAAPLIQRKSSLNPVLSTSRRQLPSNPPPPVFLSQQISPADVLPSKHKAPELNGRKSNRETRIAISIPTQKFAVPLAKFPGQATAKLSLNERDPPNRFYLYI